MWISAQLKRLTEVYNVILGEKKTELDLVKQYGIETTQSEEFMVNSKLPDCKGIYDECDLSRVLRSRRAYCEEFYIRSIIKIFGSTPVVRVVMDKSVEAPASKESCAKCFSDRFVYELISRVKHVALPVKLKVGISDIDVSFVGIGCSGSKDTGRMRACLSLKCSIDEKDKLFLVAYRDKDPKLCFFELIPKEFQNVGTNHTRYLIGDEDDNTVIHHIPKHEPSVYLISTDLLDFVTPKNTVESLYRSHKQRFDMLFREYFGQLASKVLYRERIFKKMPKESKSKEQPRSQDLFDLEKAFVSTSVLKVVMAVSLIWIAVILVREARVRQASKTKVSIL